MKNRFEHWKTFSFGEKFKSRFQTLHNYQ